MNMTYRNYFLKMIAIVTVTLMTNLGAQSPSDENRQMEFSKIMQQLSKDMQAITDAISREDWQRVKKSAHKIAHHAKPPVTEKQKIISFAGERFSIFKRSDQKTHLTAIELEQIASEKNVSLVIDTFAKLQKTCQGCHQEFRKPFKKHFYGKE